MFSGITGVEVNELVWRGDDASGGEMLTDVSVAVIELGVPVLGWELCNVEATVESGHFLTVVFVILASVVMTPLVVVPLGVVPPVDFPAGLVNVTSRDVGMGVEVTVEVIVEFVDGDEAGGSVLSSLLQRLDRRRQRMVT